ncbi:uncharacterized protein LOC114529058 [Dendronephthya gigantea]|uniref:uncharacterized protein LOC114529058 n=1 Tax=Dendronephthya gigantea TaxID=151771 RepID=UPI00106D6466|nr:uncharacterized protein LOC114529058 [Dendronephthya gigantea]
MEDIENNLHIKDVKVDCIEGVLQDADVNTTAGGDIIEEQHKYIDKIWQVKSHIGTLKYAWALSEAAVWFANGLDQERLNVDAEENWLTCDDQQKEKELMNKERKESEKVKNDIEDIQEVLEKHAEDIQTADEEIKEQKLLIQKKLSIVKEKMEKLKMLQERKQLLDSKKKEHPSAFGAGNYSLEHQTEKLKQTSEALKQCTAAVDILSQRTSLLEAERDTCKATLVKMEEKLSTLKAEQKVRSSESSEQKRMESYYKDLISCGVRVTTLSEKWLEIEISDIYECSDDIATLTLVIHFGEDKHGSLVFEDVTANCSTFFIKDLIDYLKSTSELKVFNFEVQRRFHNRMMLLREMEVLQKRFAIDWKEEEQVVRLMLGKAGQIVCSLKMEKDYPSEGSVSVVEIHGADPAIIFQDSLVTGELKTLTSWIEYLDIKYISL